MKRAFQPLVEADTSPLDITARFSFDPNFAARRGWVPRAVLLSLLLLAAVNCDRIRPLPKRAECERKAGHTSKALELVEEHLANKPRDKKAVKLRDQLKAELVTVELYSEPDGALVSVDGADPAGSTPLTIPLDAGRHVFRFTLDGHLPLDRDATAIAGTRPKLTAVLERIATPPVLDETVRDTPAVVPTPLTPAASPVNVAAVPAAAPRAHSNAPFVLGAAGIFVAIAGGVLILTSALAQQPDSATLYRQYAGYALAGVGAAAAIAALIWLLYDHRPGAGER